MADKKEDDKMTFNTLPKDINKIFQKMANNEKEKETV